MCMMIYVMILCGLSLESFRLSMAAGAIQADLTKRKITCLGVIFAVVQFFLFFLGTILRLKGETRFFLLEKMDVAIHTDCMIFAVLGCVYIWQGIREKRMEESCVHPWSVEGFTKYALKHGLMFLIVGCVSADCLNRAFWYCAEIFLFLLVASVIGLAYGYWQGIRGWRKIRVVTGCLWVVTAICLLLA